MTSDPIRYEQPTPQIARIVLASPEKRNAQDVDFLYALDDAYATALANDDVRVIILAADGPDFSSGHDLSTDWCMAGRTTRDLATGFSGDGVESWYATELEIFVGLCLRWRDIPRPTIAQVHGRVIAGGLMLIWPLDLIIASEDASFVDPVGAFCMNGHEYFTHPWELGARKAKEMLFTGEAITAEEAHRLGMVNRVVKRKSLEEETLAVAAQIAQRPPFGLRLAKRQVNHALDLQGQRNAIQSAFEAHQLAHAHNMGVYGQRVDPAGLQIIRDGAKRFAVNDNGHVAGT